MKTTVVIIDRELASGKQSPYDHPTVLAARQANQERINESVIPKQEPKIPMSYAQRQELKAHKSSYKKLSQEAKDDFTKEVYACLAKTSIPNMNLVVK